jgi:hypothetical protein
MKLESVGEVIATRTLFLATHKECKILVKLGKPQPMPPVPDAVGEHYYCPFQITGIGSEKASYAGGVDAFQSLELGLEMIGSKLAFLNKKHNGQLRWDGDENGGLGFPFPEVFRE